MINYLNGLNTGVIMNEEGFLALALKVKTSNGQTNMFYLQGYVLKDLLMILQNRLLSLQIKAADSQQDVAALIENASQALVNKLPMIEQMDLEQPDIGHLVNSLSVSFDEHGFRLLLIQKNESMHHIKVSDEQIQFMMVAIAKALDNVKNTDLINLLTTGINYVPVYDAEFRQNGTIDYSMIEIEPWKLDLFNQFYLVVYGIENKDGLELKFGAVIKAHAVINEQEIDIAAQNFASKSKKVDALCPANLNH